MEIFYLTASQMLKMFAFIILGYLLRKTKVLPENAYITMSRLETYIFVPALTLHNWMTNCNVNTLRENFVLIIYGSVMILCAMVLSYPLSRLFVKNVDSSEGEYQRCIYKYAMTFSNTAYVGNVLVLGIWGSQTFFKYSMFMFGANLLCGSWGLFILIPKGRANGNVLKETLKRIFAPPFIALFVGLFAGLFQVQQYLPDFAVDVLSEASACMGPVAMLLAGVVIGGYDLKELLTYKKVYVASLMRLIVIPTCFIFVLQLLGTSMEIITFALISFATPLGLNTVVYPASYGGDVKTGASMAVISHTLAVITIPLMCLLFIG